MTATLNTNGDICAIQKAGGEAVIQSVVMQCLRIASVKATDITDKIKKAVESYSMARALKKIKRHPDSVVNKVARKGLAEEIKNTKLEVNNSIINQSDMEIESHSSKKESVLQDKKPESFIGGPSSWDPYSKGANTDELKASLTSQALTVPGMKSDASPSELDQSSGDVDQARLPEDTVEPEEPTSNAKSLKDAVKSKHRRKKNQTNADGS